MSESAPHPCLPLPLPRERGQHIQLVMLRRMAAHGLRDAGASWLAIEHFGAGFRKPLVLLRCFVSELAQCSRRTICMAPCCAPGMTRDEGLIIAILGGEGIAPFAALTGDACDHTALTTAAALHGEVRKIALRRAGPAS